MSTGKRPTDWLSIVGMSILGVLVFALLIIVVALTALTVGWVFQ